MVSKKRFILGMISKISDKQLTVKSCILVFPTSGLELKTGNWNIRKNPTIIPCNTFLRFRIFLKLNISELILNHFGKPHKFSVNLACGCPASF